MASWLDRLRNKRQSAQQDKPSYIREVVAGSLYSLNGLKAGDAVSDIKTQIDTMRALAEDSQISTALSYYATDATTTNTAGQIIWATASKDISDKDGQDLVDMINKLFKDWNINAYARDHILELATVGNLYIPTTELYKDDAGELSQVKVAIDNNTIPNYKFDIVPSTKIPPEDILHLYSKGEPKGYIYKPDSASNNVITYAEGAIIHFSLGGLLGDYSITVKDNNGDPVEYDVLFAQPLMERAVQPTQILNLLEDSIVLSSLIRIVRFINVDCNDAENEDQINATLLKIKNAIEQQLSINTSDGDIQSYVNPQSPNNLIYLPKVNGQDAISITDLDLKSSDGQDSELLQYYQDKKLSVLGVPKEAMNFSSNEGLGGAGSVLSQRSALYANSLNRLETAYIAGWTRAINIYLEANGYSELIDKFELHMNPIITTQSTIQFEKRDAAISQAQQFVDLLKAAGVKTEDNYVNGLVEILSEVFPQIGADAKSWHVNPDEGGMEGGI